MFSVIFEVKRRPERSDEYLKLAGELKPLLEKVDGFIDNERFESQRRPGWLLSHSTWRDEKSVIRWRTVGRHHDVQARGREAVFEDYHFLASWRTAEAPKAWAPRSFAGIASSLRHRVIRVVRDYGMFDRREAPQYYPGVNR